MGWAPGLLIAAPDNTASAIYLLSSALVPDASEAPLAKTAQLLYTDTRAETGRSLGPAGDMNGDGQDDFAIAAPVENSGRVYLYLGGPACLQ